MNVFHGSQTYCKCNAFRRYEGEAVADVATEPGRGGGLASLLGVWDTGESCGVEGTSVDKGLASPSCFAGSVSTALVQR